MTAPDWLTTFAQGLEETRVGEAVRATPHLYATLESLHIIGLALLVGAAVAVDLRLIGVARNVVPVTVAARHLLPLSHVGFAVVVATGLAMFIGNAGAVTRSPAALWKFGLIALAGANIAVFHAGVYRSVARWDLATAPPIRARIAGFVSAATWSGVVVAGRFLAY